MSSIRSSIAKMNEKICTICIEEVKETHLAKIECCNHVFCKDCIHEWAFKTENTCPNCKKSFNKIITKTEEIKVPDKSELKKDALECEICEQVIADEGRHLHCGQCMDSAHLSCLRETRWDIIDGNHYHC